VEKLAAPTKTVGGVLLPESATAGKVRLDSNRSPHQKQATRRRRGAGAGGRCLFASFSFRSPSFDSPPPTPSFDSPPLTATTKQRQLTEGKVVAVGPGRRAPLSGEVIPVSVKEGDTVLLPEYGGTPLKHEGKELLLYRDDELLGVLH